jgi:7-carboxy-7-deazaguanine synthase
MIETDGVEDVSRVPHAVKIIFDVKTPGSLMQSSKTEKILPQLRPHDEVKFVLVDEKDYDFARDFIARHDLASRHKVLFSPAIGEQDMGWLPPLILRDGLPVRFQAQLHKILWGDRRGV